MWKMSANISLLFGELPFLERPAAARRAGFEYVECWWPFTRPDPSESEVSTLVEALRAAGVRLTGLNFYAGDMAAGERGVLSWPDRRDDFRRGVDSLRSIAETTGCRAFNALYGQRRPDFPDERQDEEAAANLAFAAGVVGEFGGTVLLEPLTVGENGDYPLHVPQDAIGVVERVGAEHGATNLALLFDTYHLAGNGVDLLPALAAAYPHLGHVQVADHPGRGAPGSGTIEVRALLDDLDRRGYDGWVGFEYKPAGPTADGLGWMDTLAPDRRAPH